MSLRARLLIVTVVLVGAGLVTLDGVTATALRSFMLSRLDQQLAALAQPFRLPAPKDVGALKVPNLNKIKAGSSFRRFRPSPDLYIQVRPHGSTARRLTLIDRAEHDSPRLPAHLRAPRSFNTGSLRAGGPTWRVLATSLPTHNGVLIDALPLTSVNSTIQRLLVIEAAVTAAILALTVGLALWLVRLGLAPLRAVETAVSDTAASVYGGRGVGRRVAQVDHRTEVGRLGRQFNTMVDRIEQAFAERQASEDRLRRFVADASHELRTPLTSIRGYAELFHRGAKDHPEDLAKAMRRIEEDAIRMSALVDDLLLLARLDQSRPLERTPVDLSELVTVAVETWGTTDPDRLYTPEVQPGVVVPGDHFRLRQVADNLLSNVRAHTPPGTTAKIRLYEEEGRATLEVLDDGPGLSPEDSSRVFERFYRADAARTRDQGGSGLGLAVVQALAGAHGGEVTVTDAPGHGCCFRVHLPVSDPLDPRSNANNDAGHAPLLTAATLAPPLEGGVGA